MSAAVLEIGDVRMLAFAAEGPLLARAADVSDFISAAWAHHADMVAVPVQRFADDFFRLRTGLAGEVTQKFVNYCIRLAIVGDISAHVRDSDALRDFINESNRVQHVWFVAEMAELHARLAR